MLYVIFTRHIVFGIRVHRSGDKYIMHRFDSQIQAHTVAYTDIIHVHTHELRPGDNAMPAFAHARANAQFQAYTHAYSAYTATG